MIKILSIGNSFSQDATRYLEEIAQGQIFSRNCYIGGCSLETHWNNIAADAPLYAYEAAAQKLEEISIRQALLKENWDWVTLQQVSYLAGREETYEPYIGDIISYIRQIKRNVKIAFHRTWAYDPDCTHNGFSYYDHSQEQMYQKIVQTTGKIARKYQLPIIGVGDAVQKLRSVKPFDSASGGMTLTRDGFHLSLDYGRYAAGLVWYRFFTGKSAKTVSFMPENTDPTLIQVIQENIDFLSKRK